MNRDKNLLHGDLTEKIIGCFYEVYNELGAGYLESVYEKALMIVLNEGSLEAKNQCDVPVFFRGIDIGQFKADIIVEGKVILELKCARTLNDAHAAQLINYLKATGIPVGLLLNFGNTPSFKRLVK